MRSPFAPEPVKRPVMFQTWINLTFLHWSYPPAAVKALLPQGLEVETFKGQAWVGLVPFYIKGVRAPFTPALPWVSRFAETNLRTYVRGPDGRTGVWFFSLDAARLPAVAGARLTYGLPYVWSRMHVTRRGRHLFYVSRRITSEGRTRIGIEVGEALRGREIKEFDLFLIARYRLYSMLFGRPAFAQVEHAPYPLARARVLHLEQSLTAAAGLPDPTGDPVVHFSPGVEVRVGRPTLCPVRSH